MRYPSPTNPTGTRKTLAFRCSSTQDEAGESRANKRPPLDSHVSLRCLLTGIRLSSRRSNSKPHRLSLSDRSKFGRSPATFGRVLHLARRPLTQRAFKVDFLPVRSSSPNASSLQSSAVKRVLSSQTSLSTAASNLTQISHSVRASRKSPCGQTLLHFRAFFLPLSLIQTSTNPPTPFRSVLSSLADVSRSILVRTLVAKACAVQNNNLSPPLFNSIGFGSLLCPRATQSILPAR
uniref:Uncharacterized protein n=1 Tax=Steinernema glaseri TaxID=37863 RepID=A0A1I7ZUH7_9BILA